MRNKKATNANKVRQVVPSLEIGGRLRTLKFDMNSFIELENIYGSVEAAMGSLDKGGMKAMRTILWAGLIHDEVELDELGEPVRFLITPRDVGSWISPQQLPELSAKLMEAMNVAMPDQEKGNEELEQKLKEAGVEVTKTGLAPIVATAEEEAAEKEKN